ncbi:MAG: arsenate reductase ArsC [Synergistetes bacterium]|nr:arsenate reductase ArsC [Synergistota bacterium]MCX8127899.1 arsenate reductase ArsC [Synergistota bacterium]MDW8192161.1 arsenate reductase ArsC [Synergistota bacterium]
MSKKRVLFVCTHNSARSQMAEGFLNAIYGDIYEAYSAGTKPSRVNPYAIKVMAEIGIDISHHRSKGLEEFLGEEFDYVVTVCDSARDSCPFFPGGKEYIHKGFEDPSQAVGSEEEIINKFREVRDDIKRWIESFFAEKDKG